MDAKGEGLERVHKPRSAQAVYEWYAALAEAVHEQDFRARLLGVTSGRGLTLHAGPRPEDLAATCSLVGVAADPPEPPAGDRLNHSAYVAYLHGLTATLGRAPALVTSFGLPTAPDGRAGWISDSAYGRALRAYRGEAEQQSLFIVLVFNHLEHSNAIWLKSD